MFFYLGFRSYFEAYCPVRFNISLLNTSALKTYRQEYFLMAKTTAKTTAQVVLSLLLLGNCCH